MTLRSAACALVLSLVAFAAPPAVAADWELKEGQHPQAITAADGQREIRMLLFLPKGYAEKKWPLMVFLHGGSSGGKDLQLLMRPNTPPRIVEAQADFPFIVASPQIPFEQTQWNSADVNLLVDELLRQLPVDPDRVYLTGISRGGNGVWTVAADHPERFAALAPISSRADPEIVCRLKDIPIWAFHNKGDFVTASKHVEAAVERLRSCKGQVELTIYPRDGHEAWSEAYNPALFKWLLGHTRGRPASK